jgi:uncharacterized protein
VQTVDAQPGAGVVSSPARPTILVDCDVHNKIDPMRLAAHLPERWRKKFLRYGTRAGATANFTRPRAQGAITNSWPPSGGVPGSDRAFMVEQLLEAWHHDYAILVPSDQVSAAWQPGEYGAALCAAINQDVIENWLEPESRFYASLCVPFEDAGLAVEEIERLGHHPRFVQVLLNVVTQEPLGNRKYWPVYEAAVHYDLPIAVHVSGSSGHPKTGCGWPSFYFEDHSGFQQAFQDQVISLVSSGLFDRFPTLKIVLQEGGFSWLLPLMWRLDRSYALLGDELPTLNRPLSQYCRQHFWITTQPIEEPEKPEYLMQVIELLQMDDKFLFASDYPHWDFDAPDRAIPKSVPRDLRRRIFGLNALDLYGRLPRPDNTGGRVPASTGSVPGVSKEP